MRPYELAYCIGMIEDLHETITDGFSDCPDDYIDTVTDALSSLEDASENLRSLSDLMMDLPQRNDRKQPGKAVPALPIIKHDLEDFKFNLAPIEGKNHVLILASIPADQYVSLFYAKRLNDAIQRDIRGIIDSGIKDVYIRMDQTYKPANPGYVLYNSGNVSQGIYIDDMGSAGYYGDEEPEDYE